MSPVRLHQRPQISNCQESWDPQLSSSQTWRQDYFGEIFLRNEVMKQSPKRKEKKKSAGLSSSSPKYQWNLSIEESKGRKVGREDEFGTPPQHPIISATNATQCLEALLWIKTLKDSVKEGVSCSVVSDSLQSPWTVAHQDPLSLIFPRQECWSGLPIPSPGEPPDQRLNPGLLH